MKVILLKDVRGLGRAHEVKDVADGYAHNFLLPHTYAVVATDERLKEIEAKRARAEEARQKEEEQLIKKVQSLNGKKVTIAARATEKGGLFKSLAAADVAKAIRLEHSLEIPEAAIEMDHLKTVGEHKIGLRAKSAKAELVVTIVAQ